MIWVRDIIFIAIICLSAIPIGNYIYQVMTNQSVGLLRFVQPIEKFIYRMLGYQKQPNEMTAKRYIGAVGAVSIGSFGVVFLIQLIQKWLPLNPNHVGNVSWSLAFNNAISFVTNTNWQAYSGETTMSYLTQIVGFTTQNFLSPAVGVAALLVIMRGFKRGYTTTVGNFWQDIVRFILYILIPLAFILAFIIVACGGVQTLQGNIKVGTSLIPLGPAASQYAISLLGSNGGGFFGANGGFAFSNPNAISNFFEMGAILLLPASLVVTFGHFTEKRQARLIFIVMLIFLSLAIIGTTLAELNTGIKFTGITGSSSLEGKNVINGIGNSSLWNTLATAVSNGAVNANLDSFTALGGLIPLLLIQLGEIIFGGIGSGLYGMLAFVLLTVFISGLMVGRTPEYLGKKIEPYEMKMVSLAILFPPILSLIGTAIGVNLPHIQANLVNHGPHGFTEILYAFSSMANNNGSAFGGFNGNQLGVNLIGGLVMAITRFVPLIAMILMGSSLAKKKFVAQGVGTLRTDTSLFGVLLVFIILLIGALNFVPALVLGPIADFLA
ncbi:potassium-transporting ATPase subunit KdpA [Periweissella fabalis]|uniref:Potassium-transporting ATPase potassium-binding subunit n=1 Tax=Periweissella fabalis TaxID=1070421 RepID=A0A7X6N4Y6_9LACO|nr:potassium-transporting ATPase subunit KdpA [Periweissella fabalis]MCM0598157.1 potassium-transporting ATPase subunit KdpA [Periweissella fabalis]NKZ24719.1 potassium-transporting ATPase subunit KdpA [Periweissella fabalis]